jgi:putative ABC transport system permease protein
MRAIGREHIENSKTGVHVKPLRDWMAADMRPVLQILAGAALFMFLICCANVANLVLVCATARHRELAIRASLGAGKLRLIRQLALEVLLLAAIGGMAGAGLAAVLIRLVPSIEAFYIPRTNEIVPDWRLVSIAALTTLISVLPSASSQLGKLPEAALPAHCSRSLREQEASPGPGTCSSLRSSLSHSCC